MGGELEESIWGGDIVQGVESKQLRACLGDSEHFGGVKASIYERD